MDRNEILKYMNNRKQECRLETVNVETGERRVLQEFDRVVEAPNWTPDGRALIYNSNGLIFRFDLKSLTYETIETDFADLCNNDHVLSADGKLLAVSHSSIDDLKSRIYYLPVEGGIPKLVTKNGPSYLHGWSPDGEHFSYCAERNGSYDVYTISIKTAVEKRLTFTPGLDDGPEYEPGGEKIWFNSSRSGLMQIWCMNTDGSEQRQVSDIPMNCWFPHVSPDGTKVAYVAYRTDELKPDEHLPDKHVQIRLMDLDGSNDRVLAELMGGQGTMNVNSWSPDGKYLAFVSY